MAWMNFRPGKYGSFKRQFEAAKEKAKDANGLGLGPVECGGWRFWVKDRGRKPRGGGPYMAFVFACEGLEFSVADRERCLDQYPNVFIEFGSLALMASPGGFATIWLNALAMLKALGMEYVRDRIGRIDFAIDCPGVSVETLTEPFRRGEYSTRARKVGEHSVIAPEMESVHNYQSGRKDTGFSVGTDVAFRWYDKLAKDRTNAAKMELLRRHRWNGAVPPQASRGEHQFRGLPLRELGVHSVHDWLLNRASVLKYAFRWFRVTDGPLWSKGNQHKTPTLPFWNVLESSAMNICERLPVELSRHRRQVVNPKGLRRQGFGCLISCVALARGDGLDDQDNEQFLVKLATALGEELKALVGELGPDEMRRRYMASAAEWDKRLPRSVRGS